MTDWYDPDEAEARRKQEKEEELYELRATVRKLQNTIDELRTVIKYLEEKRCK